MTIGDKVWPWAAAGTLLVLFWPWVWLFAALPGPDAWMVVVSILLIGAALEAVSGGDLVIFFETLIIGSVVLGLTGIVWLSVHCF